MPCQAEAEAPAEQAARNRIDGSGLRRLSPFQGAPPRSAAVARGSAVCAVLSGRPQLSQPGRAEEVKGNWLREIDFLTGGGPSEADAEPAEGEAGSAGTVQVAAAAGQVLQVLWGRKPESRCLRCCAALAAATTAEHKRMRHPLRWLSQLTVWMPS